MRGALRTPPGGRIPATSAAGPALSYPPTQGCTTPLAYCGGPIVAHPAVVQVSWDDPGPGGAVDPATEQLLQAWWPAVLSSEAGYLSWLTEYGTAGRNGIDGLPGSGQTFAGAGAYVGLVRMTPTAASRGAVIDDRTIRAELIAQIMAGTLPSPSCDAEGRCDTLYMIDLPPRVTGVTVTSVGQTETLCASFCGYHAGATFAGEGGSGTFAYAVFPDLTSACPACAPDGVAQDLGTSHSHELAEAITDPQLFLANLTPTTTPCERPGGWDQRAGGCGEIGDSCSWPAVIPTVSVGGQSYFVQGLFDNSRLDCETAGPTKTCASSADCAPPTPVCSAGGSCRGCLPTDCGGTTPACAAVGPSAGSCVACASDGDCQARLDAPICDATTNTCRACIQSDCSGSTPVCAYAGAYAGRCVECATASDCPAQTPACDSATYTCRTSVADGGAAVDAGEASHLDASQGADGAPEGLESTVSARGSRCDCGTAGAGDRDGLEVAVGACALAGLVRRRRRQGR